MDKKLIVVAPNLDVVTKRLSRRQVLEGFGALAIPIIGTAACSSDPGDNPGGSAGQPGLPSGGANTGGMLSTGGSGGSPSNMAGSPAAMGGGGTMGMSGGAPGGGSAPIAGSGVSGGEPVAGAPVAGSPAGGAPGGGAGAGGAGAGGTASGGTASGGATAGSGGTGGGGLLTPPSTWDAVNTCVASKEDGQGQGPFFIHELEKDDDISLFRQDIRGRYHEDAEEGIEMQLHLRILNYKSQNCGMAPVEDVDVYIWHTDGQGYYSGFGTPGGPTEQKPDDRYSGIPNQNHLENTMRFCRGVQTTNADGIVSFRSIFPGWYNGRDVHIHLVVLKKGSMSIGRQDYKQRSSSWVFTTQFYFEPSLTDEVHRNFEPYKRRTQGTLERDYLNAIQADEDRNSGLRAKATFDGNIVVAQMQVLVDPRA